MKHRTSSPAVRILVMAAAVVGLLVTSLHASAASTDARAKPRAGAYGGTPPMWVEHPYLSEIGDGRLAVRAQAYVDPFRRPSATRPADRHLRATPDRIVFSVVIAKPQYANPRRPATVRLLPDAKIMARGSQTVIAKDRRIVNVAVVLDRKTSKQLRAMSFLRQRAAISIVISHVKDTYEANNRSAAWGLTQTNDASLQPGAATLAERGYFLGIAKRQILADRGYLAKPHAGAKRATRATNVSPMYNYVYVTNSTPFQQQVNFNPNIQCMWTGASTQYPGAQSVSVPSAGLLQMAYVMEPNPYHGSLGTTWLGLNGATQGMNAPGTGQSGISALVQAATATGQSVLEHVAQDGLKGEGGTPGILAAIGFTTAKFMTTLINSDAVNGSCDNDVADFPETFALTTTVTGFGTNNQPTAWGQPGLPTTYTQTQNWNTVQPIPQPENSTFEDVAGTATPVSGPISTFCTPNSGRMPCYFQQPVQVGSQNANYTPTACPAPTVNATPSAWCTFVYNALQPMLGAQTSATYYWNGGAPSYMVSNNAAPGTNTGGSASFTGGLFQNVGPNPGMPGDAWCWGGGLVGVINCSYMNTMDANDLQNYNPMGAMNIALTYLTTPQYQSGLYTGLAAGQSGTPAPNVIVTPGTNSQGAPGLNVTCDLSTIEPFLSLPFASGGGTAVTNGTALLNTPINASGDFPTGSWNVSFFGVDPTGTPIYFPVNNATVNPISPYAFSLSPNLTSTVTNTFTVASNAMPSGFLPFINLNNLQTAQNMNVNNTTSQLAGIGCSASPSLNLPGLDITGTVPGVSNVFGQILPPAANSLNSPGWPMPGAGQSAWPSGLYNRSPWNTWDNYAWQTPVKQINVAFQGMPTYALQAVSCTAPSTTTTPSCTVPSSSGS